MTTESIKASIFDILVAMENLQHQMKQLETMKQEKLQELQSIPVEVPAEV